MGRILILGAGLLASAVWLSGCGEEGPTEVGGDLLGEGFRTFEVVLDASDFLQDDSTYDRLGSLNDVQFGLVARDFEGELNANTLFRVVVPQQVSYQNEGGQNVTDTAFTILGAELTVVIDSLADTRGGGTFEVAELTESWDPNTVTWEERVDTADVSEPWAQPGGTVGEVLGSEEWFTGDTVRISLGASALILADTANSRRGAVLRATTAGTRVRIQELSFEFRVRPASADTVITAGSIGRRAVVVSPEPPEAGPEELRVGGVPLWRSALQFRDLSDVAIPCLPTSTSCTVPLRDVKISQASLLLRPLAVGSRRIERPFRVEGRAVLRAEGVPVTRSPLSTPLGTMADSVAPALFTGISPEREVVAVPITPYIRRNLDPQGDEDPILWIALLARGEAQAPVFGYASFGSLESATPPQLRLVVTVPLREE